MHRIQLCGRGCTQKLGFIRVQDIWYATVSDHVSWGSREGCNLLREIAGSVFTLHAESTTAGPSGSLISCYGGGAGVSANDTKCSFSLKKDKGRRYQKGLGRPYLQLHRRQVSQMLLKQTS